MVTNIKQLDINAEGKMKQLSPISVLVAMICLVTTAKPEDDILFPFGVGETTVSRADDVYSDEIAPPMDVPFFGQHFSSLYVSTNGLISLGAGTDDYTPKTFPLKVPILAAFWCDIDISQTGNVTYRPYLRTPSNEVVFDRGEAVVRQAFRNQFDFTASWMLIATWYEVPFFLANNLTITNSFQAVLLTDGAESFVMYNYKEIRWTTGALNPNTGLGGIGAQVGYDTGEKGAFYYSVTGSLTDEIVNIDQRSNIATRGRWLFSLFTNAIDVVTCPNDFTIKATAGMTDASVIWSPFPSANVTEGDIIDPASITCKDQDGKVKISGDRIDVGTTTITCTTNYTVPDEDLCQFTITVIDIEPPVVTCPDNAVGSLDTGARQAVVGWSSKPIATDVVDGNITFITCRDDNHAMATSGGLYSIGVTKVTCTAHDSSFNAGLCTFTVVVSDNETPVFQGCPDDVVLLTRSTNPVTYTWTPPVFSDNSGQPVGVEFGCLATISNECHQDGFGNFSVGDTKVMYNGTDTSRNQNYCNFTVTVKGQCEYEVTEDTLLGPLSWPVTIVGLTVGSVKRCPLTTTYAGFPRAKRNCSTAPPPRYFYWEEHMPQSCGESVKTVTVEDIVEVKVTEGNVEEVAEFLANQTSASSTGDDDVGVISQILENIVSAGSGNPEVTDAVIETVANVITNAKESKDSPDSKSSSAIIQSVEAQVSLTLRQEGKVSIQQDTIHIEAVSIDPREASNGFSFVSVQQESAGSRSPEEGSLDGTEIKTFTNTSEIPNDVVASIQLPANINKLLPRDNSSTPLRASFIVYADDTLFQTGLIKDSDGVKNLTSKVAGSIVSLTVEDVILVNLTEPVVIDFKFLRSVSQEDINTTKCVFWEFGEESGFWSTEGCKLAKMTDDKVSCDCNHATNFAILVDVKGQKRTDEGSSSTPALDIISQIGGALSVIALSVTLVIYLSIRKLRTGKSRQIFIHFCFSLLMLYVVFLAGVDNARGSGGGCVFVAALLHYLTLTTMMWMAVEARNMYIGTVKVFPEDTPRYMVKVGLLAWGSPLIVLTVTLAAATKFYQNEHYCFISPGLAMYLGLLTPIGIILLHNVITFILVMRSLLKVKEASRSQQINKRLQNAVGISALMGLTWCFGFLAIEGAAFAFQLLFCLTNSLQGVIVAVMFCARREEVRVALGPYLRRICCGRDCRLPKLHSDRSYDLSKVSQSPPNSPSRNQTASLDISVSAAARDSHGQYAPVSTDVL